MVARVADDGTVTVVGEGETEIRVTNADGTVSAECSVKTAGWVAPLPPSDWGGSPAKPATPATSDRYELEWWGIVLVTAGSAVLGAAIAVAVLLAVKRGKNKRTAA
jgi:hypothetical protein